MTFSAVTENVVDVAACGIVTVDTMLTSTGDDLKLIMAPALPAAEVRATVQLDAVAGVIDTGLHENPFSSGACTMVTVPPVADADIAAADGFAAAGLKICTAE